MTPTKAFSSVAPVALALSLVLALTSWMPAGEPVLHEEFRIGRACLTTEAAGLDGDLELRRVVEEVEAFLGGQAGPGEWDPAALAGHFADLYESVEYFPAMPPDYEYWKDSTCVIHRICDSVSRIEILPAQGADRIEVTILRYMLLP